MLLLCISDIHGNLDALRAVLATAERRSFHKLLVAGDLVFPGPTAEYVPGHSLEVWRRLAAANAVLVQGVSDKALVALDADAVVATSEHEKSMLARVREVRKELGDLVIERLRRLPTHARVPLEDGGELVLVHGSPADPGEPLTHDLDDEDVNALLGADPADIVVCGMSHVPFTRELGDVKIVNVGSVGEAPDGAVDGPGGKKRPRVAHATWIESTPAGLAVEHIAVPLDPET
jgi:predicted phosphodiesterase